MSNYTTMFFSCVYRQERKCDWIPNILCAAMCFICDKNMTVTEPNIVTFLRKL